MKLGEAVDAVWLLGVPPKPHEDARVFSWDKYTGGHAGVLPALVAYATEEVARDLITEVKEYWEQAHTT